MNFEKTVILGLEKFVSDVSLTSSEIEEKLAPVYKGLKLPEGRLELMTGIKERKVWPRGTRPSHLSTQAAENLFRGSKIKRDEVDLLIHSSVCRDFLEPSTASVVHHSLGLKEHCMIFDLSNACLGVINSMVMAAQMIERGQIKKALIVSGENGGPLLEETINSLNKKMENGELTRKNIKKYIANLTIGSAATAILLGSKDEYPEAPAITTAVVATDSSAHVLCQGDGSPDSLMMETDSEALLHKGVTLATHTFEKFKKSSKWEIKDLNYVLTHQVGKAHEELTLKTLGVEELPTYRTYPEYGNTGSSALPLTLIELMKNKTVSLNPKDKICLMGIGSGLTSIIMGLEWGQLPLKENN
jgi:3-oxoacyl-[acyl-carrier-protein] synthase III